MEKHYEYIENEFDVNDYEYMHLEEYDQRYCGTLEGGCDEETYQIRKGHLEHFLCKVQQPEPMYVFTNGKHKKPELLSPTQCGLLLDRKSVV